MLLNFLRLDDFLGVCERNDSGKHPLGKQKQSIIIDESNISVWNKKFLYVFVPLIFSSIIVLFRMNEGDAYELLKDFSLILQSIRFVIAFKY